MSAGTETTASFVLPTSANGMALILVQAVPLADSLFNEAAIPIALGARSRSGSRAKT